MKDKGDAKSFALPCFHLIIGRGARHLVEAAALDTGDGGAVTRTATLQSSAHRPPANTVSLVLRGGL